jgi:glycosyltransferase involved in cell wall biosynthesis
MDLSKINLNNLILELRKDIRYKFPLFLKNNSIEFQYWLLTSGINEYASIKLDSKFKALMTSPSNTKGLSLLQEIVWLNRPDVQKIYHIHENVPEYLNWFFVHGVGEHKLWPLLTLEERFRACKQNGPWQKELLLEFLLQAEKDLLNPNSKQEVTGDFGVNLIGYVHGQLGIGEDIRMAARAFDQIGMSIALVNFPPGIDIPQHDLSFANRVVSVGPYAINLFCMTALEHGRFYAERGPEQLENRYNIGYWPWELSQWPAEWAELINLVDEVWVSSVHTMEAILPICNAVDFPIPVRLMPMSAPAIGQNLKEHALHKHRMETRKLFDLPTTACLFCFSFDLNSSINRKNPEVIIKSFQLAFPIEGSAEDNVGLVIKVHPPKRPNPKWDRLKLASSQDRRIRIIEITLPQDKLLALYQACDCFVSLHRAEGFGRGIAEALQLGLRVIATNYGGNVDFCKRPEFTDRVKLIPYRLVKLRAGHYPYGKNQVWANPDAREAAASMRDVAHQVRSSKGRLLPVPTDGWPVFSLREVGDRYYLRLLEIWSNEIQNKSSLASRS